MTDIVISCGSVELRAITQRHAHQLLRVAGDDDLVRYLNWPALRSLDEAQSAIDRFAQQRARGETVVLGIFDRERSDLLGSTGVIRLELDEGTGEVGTWIGTAFQGAGRNRDVKAATFALGFDVLGLRRLEFLVRTDNERSLRAMRTLPGVTHEGTLRDRLRRADGGYADADLFAILAPEWSREQYLPVEVNGTAS